MVGIDVINELQKIDKRIAYPEKRLGKDLLEPFTTEVNGSRKILYSLQSDQVMQIDYPEMAFIQTGYENEFGRRSSSFKVYEDNAEVVGIINKYPFIQNDLYKHYYVLVYKPEKNILDVIERIPYTHIVEEYGYMLNNEYIDNLKIGSKIQKGDVYSKSIGFDKYNNSIIGVNLLTTYLATNMTTEDAIIISKSAADRISSKLIKEEIIMINDNDILLNLYGNDTIYKSFPDIGERGNGIILGVRRENKSESLFSQSYDRLKTLFASDTPLIGDGAVIDLEVFCNNPENLNNIYNTQIKQYYDCDIDFANNLCSAVYTFLDSHEGCKLGYDLDKLVYNKKKFLDGSQFMYNRSIFSNIVLKFTIIEQNKLQKGDKLTNRYGGKGVISKIMPDEDMPKCDDGTPVEMIYNQGSTVNRLNPAQLFETEINSASVRLLRHLAQTVPIVDKNEFVRITTERISKFISFLSTTLADEFVKYVEAFPQEERFAYLYGIIFIDKVLTLSLLPIQEVVTIDKMAELFKEFPECRSQKAITVVKDSNGERHEVKTINPLLIGHQYIYRLKQYGKEKFSATSLSFTNNVGENSRNKSQKMSTSVFTTTPIRFGGMESASFSHIGNDVNVLMLMLYSSSPQARRLTKKLLIGDPYDENIDLSSNVSSRKAEILNVMLKSIGIRLIFRKYKKFNRIKLNAVQKGERRIINAVFKGNVVVKL